MTTPPTQLAGLQTEIQNPHTVEIDQVPTLELCRILNREDREVASSVERCIPVIAEVIDTLSERVYNGGRVFYIRAGTSGRLGVLDASEIPPTYSAPSSQFIALIAGGDHALRNAKEGAEDDRNGAEADLKAFNLDPKVDSLVGIASSGRTPYVLGGLSYAKSLGATTVALVCVSPSAAGIEGNADYLISAATGPEAVTGSTRMKAGTATKLVLNMISTGIMIKLGKTYGNLVATNLKLKQRARNILRFVGGAACTQSDLELDEILECCRGSVKLAAIVITLKLSVVEAEDRLQRSKGVLSRVFAEAHEKKARQETYDNDLVLCVDAGGTSCKAVIMSKDGEMGMGRAGPCNVTNVDIKTAISTISNAIPEAVNNCQVTKGCQIQTIKLSSAWIGIAGYDRPSLSPTIDNSISELLGLPLGTKLKITTDIDLLPISMISQAELDFVTVVVSGTGSIAMNYVKVDGQCRRMHRVGGWGYLLGDDGSGYDIGREALRTALHSSDLHKYFKDLYPDSKPEDLLSTILMPSLAVHQAEISPLTVTKRIAGVAKLVLSAAMYDDEAKRIVNDGVSRFVDQVALLTHAGGIDLSRTVLILAGGMMQDELYKTTLMSSLDAKCGVFKQTEIVTQPAVVGARYLLSRIV
ncbi:putative glucokinase regulator family protein [Xylaria digitata]|nr:putative glucokinase regulator family protein [Xylaria digitata]